MAKCERISSFVGSFEVTFVRYSMSKLVLHLEDKVGWSLFESFRWGDKIKMQNIIAMVSDIWFELIWTPA